jgi:porphobilinogen deaminase
MDGDRFCVSPHRRLTDEQRQFLKAHKAEIISELQAEQQRAEISAERTASEIIEKLMVRCYTPLGNPVDVEARDQAHAAFLRRMNPKQETDHEQR